MGEIFLAVFNAGVAAGWIVIAVLLIRTISKRLPAFIHCILWNIVLVRLLLPVSNLFPRTRFSLIPSDTSVSKGEGNISLGFSTGFPAADDFLNDRALNSMYEGVTAEAGLYERMTFTCGIIWVVVAFALLSYGIYSYLKLKRDISEAVPYRDNIYRCAAASESPFIAGFVRPKIYIGYSLGENEERLILAHENAHITRRDYIVKLVWYIVLCVYWFNPLIWLAYILLCRDMERACDEKVLSKSDADLRKEYARTLLSFSTGKRSGIAYPAAFCENNVKERIKNIISYKKPGRVLIGTGAAMIIIFAAVFLSNPVIPASGDDVYMYHPADDRFGTPSLVFHENGNRCTFNRFAMDSNYITGPCYEKNDILILTDEGSEDKYYFSIQGEGDDKTYIFNARKSSPLAEFRLESGNKLAIPDGAVFKKSAV